MDLSYILCLTDCHDGLHRSAIKLTERAGIDHFKAAVLSCDLAQSLCVDLEISQLVA